jgi:hypothetical protein
MINELEIQLRDLLELELIDFLDNRSDESIALIRTPVGKTGMLLINIFSPREKIFWNFGLYGKAASITLEQMYNNQKTALKVINKAIADTSANPKDINVYELLYFTKFKGEDYYPYNAKYCEPVFQRLSNRHISFSINESSYSKWIKYFNEQVVQFNRDCFKCANEEDFIGAISEDELENRFGYMQLSTLPTKLSQSECHKILEDLNEFDGAWHFDKILYLIMCTSSGGINISLPDFLASSPNWEIYKSIILKRIEIALSCYCCITLEKLYEQLDAWNWKELLPDEKINIDDTIKSKLKKYPVLYADLSD